MAVLVGVLRGLLVLLLLDLRLLLFLDAVRHAGVLRGGLGLLKLLTLHRAALEDHHTARRRRVRLELRAHHVQDDEEDPEANHDTNVAVRTRPLVAVLEVGIPRRVDQRFARARTGHRAHLVRRVRAGRRREHLARSTGQVLSTVLVHHHHFEAERNRVTVRQPAPPDHHGRTGDRIAGVQRRVNDRQTGHHRRDRHGARPGRHCTEEGDHGEGQEHRREVENKELVRTDRQAGHEVEHHHKDGHGDRPNGNVQQDITERVRRRVEHSEALLTDDDRTLHVAVGHLGHGRERIVQQSKEDHTTAREQRRGVLGHQEIHGTNNQRLEQRSSRRDDRRVHVTPRNLRTTLDRQADLLWPRKHVARVLARTARALATDAVDVLVTELT